MDGWGSRKLILTAICLIVLVLIPIVYQKLGISEATTLLVLGAVASATGVYQIANVWEKKNGSNS